MSGGGNSAAQAANQAEAQRQSSIANTQRQVNNVFNSPQRAKDIGDFVNATRDYYSQDLDRQKGQADRGLKFALAKSGLTGGSTQVDQQGLLADNYNRGLLQVEQKAQGAGASLSAADQDARSRLITLATSGLDSTTAASQAAAAMRSNLQAGQSSAQLGSLGDSFAQFNDFAKQAKAAQQQREGYYAGLGGKNSVLYGGGGNTGYGGSP
jgi:hypothetical protein